MSVLHSRITGEQYLETPDHHPYGTPDTPMVMPASHHTYANGQVLYGTIHPLVTADGAVVPAFADVDYPATMPAGTH